MSTMPLSTTTAEQLQELFKQAREKGGFSYIYTLLRVGGMVVGRVDSFEGAKELLGTLSQAANLDESRSRALLLETYKNLVEVEEVYRLLRNLINCSKGAKDFDLIGTVDEDLSNVPRPSSVIEMMARTAKDAGFEELAEHVRRLSDQEIYDALADLQPNSRPEGLSVGQGDAKRVIDWQVLTALASEALSFYQHIFQLHTEAKREFIGVPKLHKWPRFEVLELLVSDTDGLYGFRVHFSNGSSASYERHRDRSLPMNLMIGREGLSLMQGSLDDLKPEWRIGDKRLYEVGLPGRYNPYGQWKPLVYPGDSDPLQQEAFKSTKDERVRGALFYMMCTGHRLIEFAAKATVELPDELTALPGGMYLFRCPFEVKGVLPENLVIYDGTIVLTDVSLDGIRQGLIEISRAMNRLAFTFDCTISWWQKYLMDCHEGGVATPSIEDLELLGKELKSPLSEEGMRIIDAAIDWYQRGRNSESPFNAFLCYWIAMEGLALNVVEGKLGIESQYGITLTDAEASGASMRDCIERYLAEYRQTGAMEVFKSIYFECIQPLTRRTKTALQAVFGPASNVLMSVYDRKDPVALSEIRHKLAHGKFESWTFSDADLVRDRLGEMAQLSREFIFRLALGLRPEQPVPVWSGLHRASFGMTDPRSTLVVSREDLLPTTDWRIRPEWIE